MVQHTSPKCRSQIGSMALKLFLKDKLVRWLSNCFCPGYVTTMQISNWFDGSLRNELVRWLSNCFYQGSYKHITISIGLLLPVDMRLMNGDCWPVATICRMLTGDCWLVVMKMNYQNCVTLHRCPSDRNSPGQR